MERVGLNGTSRARGSASVALGDSGAYANRRRVSGVARTVVSLAEVRMPAGDNPQHEVTLSRLTGVLNSSDPNFNDVKVHEVTFSDCVAGTGTHRGYDVNIHPGGDKTFTRHEGVTKTVAMLNEAPQTTFEGTWWCTGGTGRFQGITGRGTYRGRVTSTGLAYVFEGEYEMRQDRDRHATPARWFLPSAS
jgi:hypothetical protein